MSSIFDNVDEITICLHSGKDINIDVTEKLKDGNVAYILGNKFARITAYVMLDKIIESIDFYIKMAKQLKEAHYSDSFCEDFIKYAYTTAMGIASRQDNKLLSEIVEVIYWRFLQIEFTHLEKQELVDILIELRETALLVKRDFYESCVII